MLFNLIATLPLLGAASLVLAEPAPYRIGMMSSDVNPLALIKRQAGYQPTETYCGPGDTCAESCGPGQETCPSNDDTTYCYNPTIKDTCCPNLSGHSCKDGFYCTEDTTQETWCCPNGMDLAACQAAYSITGALVSLTGTAAAPSATATPPTTSKSASSSPSITKATHSLPSAPLNSPTGAPSFGNATIPVVTRTSTTTGVAAATTSTKAVFTGGANSLFSESGSQIIVAGMFGLLAAL